MGFLVASLDLASAVAIGAGTLVALCLAWWAQRRLQWNRRYGASLPPLAPSGALFNTFVGHYKRLQHFRNMSRWCAESTSQDTSSGTVFRLSSLNPGGTIVCCDYKLARLLLAGSPDGSVPESEKSLVSRRLNLIDGVNSLLSYATSHPERARIRKAIAPAFAPSYLSRTALGTIHSVTRESMRRMDECAAKKQPMSMKSEALHVTYEILIESVFSMSLKEIGFSSEEFLEAQEIYTRELIRRFFLPFRRYMFWDSGVKECKKATQLLLDFAQRAIDNYRSGKARNRFVSEGEEGFTIMNHVMNHSYLSEEHRLSDVVLFMVAGNETTTNTLTFVVYSMIKHPEALSKLRAELDAIDPSGAWLSDEKEGGEESEQRGGGGRRLMTYTDLANAECLHNYIREVQRVYPIAAVISRQPDDDIHYNGMVIPKGTFVPVSFHSMYKQSWIDRPDVFDPDRWADTAPQAAKLREMLMPFSVGKRNCIGQTLAMMELRVLAGNLLRYYDFELVGPEPNIDLFVTLKLDELDVKVKTR